MLILTKEALEVQNALLSKGLETTLNEKKSKIRLHKHLIAKHIMKIMKLLNLNVLDDSLSKTPFRIAKMYIEEIFSGLDYNNFPKITIIKNKTKIDNIITIRDITLISTCEHHFITIDGKATISYIPKEYIIGLSKINRIVQFFSRRPQIQERLTQQILLALQTLIKTNNVAVSIDAIHYCVKQRGICDTTSTTTTASLGGLFQYHQNMRQEFLNMTKR